MKERRRNPSSNRLLRLHRRLASRREELLRRLRVDLSILKGSGGDESTSDSLDAAFDSITGDVSSQLAEMEARELANVERALARLRDGQYGKCEICGGRIAAARLNAVPYTTTCICCKSQLERMSDGADPVVPSLWERMAEVSLEEADERRVRNELNFLRD